MYKMDDCTATGGMRAMRINMYTGGIGSRGAPGACTPPPPHTHTHTHLKSSSYPPGIIYYRYIVLYNIFWGGGDSELCYY